MTLEASTSTNKSLKDFDELMSTPIDFSGYILNGLKIKNLTQEIMLGPAFRLLKGTRSNYVELEYDFEECYKAFSEKLDWENPKGSDYPFDLSKPLPLIPRRKHPRVPFEYFINDNLKYLQGGVSTMTYTTSTTKTKAAQVSHIGEKNAVTHVKINDIEDILLLVVQNRLTNLSGDDVADFINVTKPDTIRPDLRKRHPYTPYKDPQGFIYVDDYKRNRLMRTDKLYKFSDGTLTRLLSSLEDITKNIDMEYLPKRRWSTLEKKRVHFMIKDINKLLKERRVMRSLEKFVVKHAEFDESDTYVLERFDTSAGNPVKEILLKLNLPDHRSILTDWKIKRRSVKDKEIQERCIIKAFQDYQIKKGMSMSVQKSQVHEMGKFKRWRNEIMLG
ncbi:hypothetical protein Tco_1014172 [Tanacetum coccineum]